jgi:hypothetical protein
MQHATRAYNESKDVAAVHERVDITCEAFEPAPPGSRGTYRVIY